MDTAKIEKQIAAMSSQIVELEERGAHIAAYEIRRARDRLFDKLHRTRMAADPTFDKDLRSAFAPEISSSQKTASRHCPICQGPHRTHTKRGVAAPRSRPRRRSP